VCRRRSVQAVRVGGDEYGAYPPRYNEKIGPVHAY
jgi:hypothetical protein